MNEEFETLRDLETHVEGLKVVTIDDLRQGTVKWIREDMKWGKSNFGKFFIKRWMKRFNITEEDLRTKDALLGGNE